MTHEWQRALDRAEEDLEAVAELLRSRHYAQSGSRAYFAAFTAAAAALLRLGESRSKHSGVLSGFNELLVKPGEVEASAGRTLRWLFDLRNRADYRWSPLTEEEATEALDGARHFVAVVNLWIEKRESPETGGQGNGRP
ncbi:hypothetical protein BH20ACT23_BH20ACT23_18460 [soil metagenome]